MYEKEIQDIKNKLRELRELRDSMNNSLNELCKNWNNHNLSVYEYDFKLYTDKLRELYKD